MLCNYEKHIRENNEIFKRNFPENKMCIIPDYRGEYKQYMFRYVYPVVLYRIIIEFGYVPYSEYKIKSYYCDDRVHNKFDNPQWFVSL